MIDLKNKKVALVYDRVNKWGGAERVLLALHELFPDAPLYTSVYDEKKATWAKVFTEVKPSWIQKIPFASSHHESIPFLMPFAFENFSFEDYDLVVSITSEAAKGIVTKPHTKHICYCLTPTRYLWSGYKEYFANSLLRIASAPLVNYLKKWDRFAAQRPDAYIAISDEVRNRIKKYYGRDAELVYPPVEMSNVKYQISNVKKKQKDYFLVVSRLVPYKRVDLAVEACNELKLPLVIVGTGSEDKRLRAMAGPTVTFAGNVSDEELASYYTGSRALLFPAYEDFGISVVEAQTFGKPVIAYRAGGALETIVEGKTGMFFAPQTKEALKQVIREFDKSRFKSEECKKQAEKFSLEVFKKSFIKTVNGIM